MCFLWYQYRSRDSGEQTNRGGVEDLLAKDPSLVGREPTATAFTWTVSSKRFTEEEILLWKSSSAFKAKDLGSETFFGRRWDGTSVERQQRNNPWRMKSGL